MVHSAVLVLALAATTPSDIPSRVERVVSSLLPPTTLRNRWAAPARLSDRMAYYHTPGLSIAVVNDGRIEWARAFGVAEAGRPLTERDALPGGIDQQADLRPGGDAPGAGRKAEPR